MKKRTKNDIRLGQDYLSPETKLIEIHLEAVFCTSEFKIDDWKEDDDILDFN